MHHISSNQWYTCSKLHSVNLESMKICIVDVVVVKMSWFVYFITLRHCIGARGGAVG